MKHNENIKYHPILQDYAGWKLKLLEMGWIPKRESQWSPRAISEICRLYDIDLNALEKVLIKKKFNSKEQVALASQLAMSYPDKKSVKVFFYGLNEWSPDALNANEVVPKADKIEKDLKSTEIAGKIKKLDELLREVNSM